MAKKSSEAEPVEISVEDQVDSWREEQLSIAGYPPDSALRMSMNRGIDLHRALQLLSEGCSPLTAEEILT